MANEINTGSEKLLTRILADAEADAANIARESDAEVKAILDQGEKDAAAESGLARTKAEKAAEEILARCRTNAELDARKYALAARRSLIAEAFEEAYKKLCALSGAEREKLLAVCLSKEAEGGEQVLPAAADRAALEKLIPEISRQLENAGRAPLSLAAENLPADGGFLLRSCGYDKNCSFEAMLREIRAAEESRVAAMLFS